MYKNSPSAAPVDFAPLRDLLRAARAGGQRQLPEPEAKSLLDRIGVPVPRGGVARAAADLAGLCERLAPPFALKLVSPEVLHKSDIGGLELNVAAGEQAQAFARLLDRVRGAQAGIRVDGVLVEEMQAGGAEMIAAVTRDAQLGWVAMLGCGGVWVEVLRDVSFRLLPIDGDDVREMLGELKGAALLDAVRGRPPLDREALVDAVLRLAELASACEDELLEIELNPLLVMPRGVSALDAVMRLRQEA